MQTWTQVYDPLGNLWLSSLIAAIPIIFFFVALAGLRMKGYVAATITVALALAVAAWRLLPMMFLMREIRELAGKLSTWTRPTPNHPAKAVEKKTHDSA